MKLERTVLVFLSRARHYTDVKSQNLLNTYSAVPKVMQQDGGK